MFTRQAPPLLNQMWLGGMSPAAASAIQNLLGQCRAPLWHNGPVRLDHTRDSMRLISPDSGQFEFPGSQLPQPEDFPPQEEEGPQPGGFLPPDHMPFEPPQPDGPGEGPRIPLQPGLPTSSYFAGPYLFLDPNFRAFGLRCVDERRHAVFPAGLNDPNRVHSVQFEGRSQSPYASLSITERPNETEFLVNLTQLTEVEFVSDVDLTDPTKIVFTVDKGLVFGHQPAYRTIEITLTDCPS